VLKASGHEGGFSDPLVDCRLSRERFRADKAPALRVEQVEATKWRVPIYAPDKLKARNWLQLIEEKLAPGANVVRDGRSIYLYLNEPPLIPGIEVVSASIQSTSTPINNELSLKKDIKQLSSNATPCRLWLQSKSDPTASIPLTFYGYAEPNSNSPFLTEPRAFNLMFRTHIGVGEVETEHNGTATTGEALGSLVYLRPETAQGIFSNFPLLHRTSGQPTLPFGIAQYGKSFRNEIRTEKSAFRTCEFEQLELEYFIPPIIGIAEQWLERWQQWRLAWWRAYAVNGGQVTASTTTTNDDSLLVDNVFRLRAHESNELAHYAKACHDIEYRFPWGWGEIEGVANRGDHDLRQHAEATRSLAGLELPYAIDEKGKPRKGIPWVIEASAGLNRACLVYLLDAYTVETITTETSSAERTYLRLHPRIAPVQVAVTPLLRNAALLDTARKISAQLRWLGIRTALDTTSASIGRRYARQDEAGTPWCVTVDFENDGQVTLRERDSMQQTRVAIDQVAHLLRSRLDDTGFKPPLDA
jgi:glycyl-tRNA synthetase